jgi:hypothetical protein
LNEPDFLGSEIHTTWLDELLRRPRTASKDFSSDFDIAAIAAALWHETRNEKPDGTVSAAQESRWKSAGRNEQVDRRP